MAAGAQLLASRRREFGLYRVFAVVLVVVIGAGFHRFVLGPLAMADPSNADAPTGAASG